MLVNMNQKDVVGNYGRMSLRSRSRFKIFSKLLGQMIHGSYEL